MASSGNTILIREAAQNYSDAYLTGHAQVAYSLLSHPCQQRIGRAAFFQIVHAAGAQYGKAIPFSSISVDLQRDMARLSYTYEDVPAINQTDQPWVWGNSHWKYDSC